MNRKNRSGGMRSMLWKNYIFMVFISSVLVLVPFCLIILFSNFIRDGLAAQKYSASTLIQDDPGEIDIKGILENHGGVQIVSKDLQVRTLGGYHQIPERTLTVQEWTDWLLKMKSEGNGTSYSVAYSEKGEFWLVTEFPISMVILFLVDWNADSVDFSYMCAGAVGILLVYLLLLGLSAVVYSRITARNLTGPVHKLCALMEGMEEVFRGEKVFQKKSHQQPCKVDLLRGIGFRKKKKEDRKIGNEIFQNRKIPYELRELYSGFFHMREELFRQEQIKEEMRQNRNRLVRDISHDLKNPLAGIQGYAELSLQKKDLDAETLSGYLRIIYQNSVRANTLIQGLFEYSKLESVDFKLNCKKTDLCELLRLKMAEFIPVLEDKGFEYETGIPEQEIFYMLDLGLINRVFDNLLENAVRYNPAGTKIGLFLEKKNKNVQIEVVDNGIGMDPGFSKHVFEAFSREEGEARNSKTGGSGLGLAIVERIVRLHGGGIKLQTKKGEGCRFCIWLPDGGLEGKECFKCVLGQEGSTDQGDFR